jgi:hypothetical protein
MYIKKATVIIGFAAIIFSCQHKSVPASAAKKDEVSTTAKPTPPPPPPSTPAKPIDIPVSRSAPITDLTPAQLGQRVFETRCGRCHGLKVPMNYTQAAWGNLVDKMAPRAKLTEDEKAQVLAYVRANAKDAPRG